ncbi:MAG: hypothetical protein L6Q71_02965, partial [Planctomycetes bacterium]|nr:hypothetical protein [Planctomycetota bacterium]
LLCSAVIPFMYAAYLRQYADMQPSAVIRVQAVIAELERQKAQGETSRVLILGSSVVREGVDANLVEQTLSRTGVYNLSMPEGGLFEIWAISRAVARSSPRTVVMALRSSDFMPSKSMRDLYAREFVINHGIDWNSGEDKLILVSMQDAIRQLAEQGPMRCQWESRRYFRDWTNTLAVALLPGTQREQAYMRNVKDPWTLTGPLSAGVVRTQLLATQRSMETAKFQANAPNILAFEVALDRMKSAGIDVVVALAPLHPDVLQFVPEVYSVTLLRYLHDKRIPAFDHSALVRSSEYWNDAVHLNAEGRNLWSLRIADDLRERFANPAVARNNNTSTVEGSLLNSRHS